MAKIQVLEQTVAELIAAGEVVERPASIVKELVENSIDAGATQIAIEIKGGGIGYIRITDNGHGIAPEDVPTAFLRHATSKISSAEDLDWISTLGFRGEALASIAAVSKVEITTKTPESLDGTTYSIQGEEVKGPFPAGAPTGTTLIIRDVFYNVPARMKFLRRDISEGNAVAQAVDKCALSNPEIAFTFIRDSDTKLKTSGNGDLRAVIAAIYGRDFAANMIPVEYEFDNIKVSGLTGLPSETRPNRTYQNFFINKRYVRTRTCSVAVEQAYKGKLMTGRFPVCVLNLQMDASQIDPNVHPAKIEIRFTEEKPVFNAVYYAIKSALSSLEAPLGDEGRKTSPAESSPKPFERKDMPTSEAPEQQRIDQQSLAIASKAGPEVKGEKSNVDLQESAISTKFLEPMELNSGTKMRKNWGISEESLTVNEKDNIISTNFSQISPASDSKLSIGAKPNEIPQASSSEEYMAQSSMPINMRLIGELFDTYILLEQEGELLLVDKHAAHERILYEEIRVAASQQRDRQVLLSPMPVTLQRNEYAILLEHLDTVNDIGFLVEDFGTGTLIVRETPVLLEGQDVTFLLSEIAEKLLQQQSDLTPKALEDLYDSIACKTALRAGDKNNPAELKEIIRLLTVNPHITHCPHGRPIVLKIPRQEIEKMFGRLGS